MDSRCVEIFTNVFERLFSVRDQADQQKELQAKLKKNITFYSSKQKINFLQIKVAL